jgi:beta-glucanase (GH16 family)
VYACEWTALSIKFYIDGALYFTFANNNTLPFNQNFFVLLNLAMGGTFGGPVDSGFTTATYEVDYVRVFQ